MYLTTKLLEVKLEPAGLGGIKKTKTLWEKMVRNYQGGGETTEQQGRLSTVHRLL